MTRGQETGARSSRKTLKLRSGIPAPMGARGLPCSMRGSMGALLRLCWVPHTSNTHLDTSRGGAKSPSLEQSFRKYSNGMVAYLEITEYNKVKQ